MAHEGEREKRSRSKQRNDPNKRSKKKGRVLVDEVIRPVCGGSRAERERWRDGSENRENLMRTYSSTSASSTSDISRSTQGILRDRQLKEMREKMRLEMEKKYKANAIVEGKKVTLKECKKEMKEKIKKEIADNTWRCIKFFPPERQRQLELTAVVLKTFVEECPEWPKDNEEQQRIFIENYQQIVAHWLNERRCYVVTRLKDAIHAWYQKNKKVPDLELFRKAATRELDLDIEEHMDFMKWYWTVLLPRATGNHSDWHRDIRYYYTISDACIPEGEYKDTMHIPISTEAFLLTAMENYVESWENFWKLKEENPGRRIQKCKDSNGVGNKSKTDTDIIKYVSDKKYFAKWTDFDSGASPNGGWSNEGLEQYRKNFEKLQVARKDRMEEVHEFEERVLQEVRKSANIKVTSPEEHKSQKGNNDGKGQDDSGIINPHLGDDVYQHYISKADKENHEDTNSKSGLSSVRDDFGSSSSSDESDRSDMERHVETDHSDSEEED
mmetsp:Transcript_14660/g.26258  ORF Transcript_14660/g.26258 Transcript_14660/m.26258 type:complete len:498 (-) Transcript_14660:92-1585(-)